MDRNGNIAERQYKMIRKISKIIKQNGEIFIFGAGKCGIELYDNLNSLFPNVHISLLDNDKTKTDSFFSIGDKIHNIACPEVLKNIKQEYIVIISSSVHYKEMQYQLRKIGVNDSNIVLLEECLQNELKRSCDRIKRRTPKNQLNFVVDLAEHCNLNCQMCDHFSPLANKKFTALEGFERDIKRMREIFGDDILHIDLEGGEPLLHPTPHLFIETVRKVFPQTVIQIFTNGILLNKMPEDFWKSCRDNDVVLEVTQYPINFDYDIVRKLAQSKGVKYKVYDGEGVKDSWYKPIDMNGSQNIYDSFHNCYMANGECAMLKEGKLYPCTVVPNFSTFNSYFGKDLKVTSDDYIDIYADVTKGEIFEFLSNPIPACRYCNVNARSGGHEWRISSKKIEEWT